MAYLLSICIPTYNRAPFLKKTLESIVSQREFLQTEEVEVVISDNCSSDDTPTVVQSFCAKYGDKIKYFKTKQNIGFRNFEYVLSKGTGAYLKLNNDTLSHVTTSLADMLAVIKKYQESKPVLFFRNVKREETEIVCSSLNDFIEEISFFNTWIGSFGMWKSDFNTKEDWFRYNHSELPHTDILCRQIAACHKAVVVQREIGYSLQVNKKGGYNIAEVFGHNYLAILKEFVAKGEIARATYEAEKKNILLNHINFYYFDVKQQYAFKKSGYFKWLWPDYKYNFYFYVKYIRVLIKKIRHFFYSAYEVERLDGRYKVKIILGKKTIQKISDLPCQ